MSEVVSFYLRFGFLVAMYKFGLGCHRVSPSASAKCDGTMRLTLIIIVALLFSERLSGQTVDQAIARINIYVKTIDSLFFEKKITKTA
jgi:hypothetical protein